MSEQKPRQPIWVLSALLLAVVFAAGSVWTIANLSALREQAVPPSGSVQSSTDPDTKAAPVGNAEDMQVSAGTTSENSATGITVRAPNADRAQDSNQRLSELRERYRYEQDGAEVSESDSGALVILSQQPQVLDELREWFFSDPEGFIELAAEEERDSYVQAVLRTQINPSNVHLLGEQMHIRHRHLVDIAYQNELHIQNPQPFLDMFDQFAASHLISVPDSVIAATAEVDYWGHRNALLEQAAVNREPKVYFDVLAQQGQDDLFSLAQQMWSAHVADEYPDVLTGGTGAIERIRLAYQYGVDQAPAELAKLQSEGLFVDETIQTYTDVEDAAERFTEIYPQLRYDQNLMIWVLPE